MAEKNKISSMPRVEVLDGNEIVPLVQSGDNKAVTTEKLKEYFRDSAFVIFDEIDNSNPTVSDAPLSGYYPMIDIVYLPQRDMFVERGIFRGFEEVRVYSSNFSRSGDFQEGYAIRQDKVFFCVADKSMYIHNGGLQNLFNTIRINVMTEEELNNLKNPIEGAIYATIEE